MDTVDKIITLDTHFLAATSVIGSYLIASDEGLILIDTGPDTTFENLKSAIHGAGFDWKAVKHVLLTHIHFDHAGAAWEFAANNAKIYVHPIGLPHLENPGKLWNSAKRIYQEDMEKLWGRMKPIDKGLLVPVSDGEELKIGGLVFYVHYTPGHAIHHNAYQFGDIVFTGDVGGVKINGGPVNPPCPPPDINVETWKNSIQKIKDLNPKALYLAHFGRVEEVEKHFANLEAELDNWKNWIKPYYEQNINPEKLVPKFVEYTQNRLRKAGVSKENIQRYEKGNPSYMSVTGLMRYWKLKEQKRI